MRDSIVDHSQQSPIFTFYPFGPLLASSPHMALKNLDHLWPELPNLFIFVPSQLSPPPSWITWAYDPTNYSLSLIMNTLIRKHSKSLFHVHSSAHSAPFLLFNKSSLDSKFRTWSNWQIPCMLGVGRDYPGKGHDQMGISWGEGILSWSWVRCYLWISDHSGHCGHRITGTHKTLLAIDGGHWGSDDGIGGSEQ